MAGKGIGLPEMGGAMPGMDTGTLNNILQPYGLSEPSQLMAPGPFENMPSFGTAHPGIASRLDNALIAVSLMGPTGATAGENISNVARAALGVGPYRRQFAAQQQMLPIEMASKIGGLQAQQAMAKLHEQMGEYYSSRADDLEGRNQRLFQVAALNSNSRDAAHMQVGPNGFAQMYQVDPTTMKGSWTDTDIPNATFQASGARARVTSMLGSGEGSAVVEANLAAKYGGHAAVEALLNNPTPEFTKDLNAEYAAQQRASAGYQGTQFRSGTVPEADIYNKQFQADNEFYTSASKALNPGDPVKHKKEWVDQLRDAWYTNPANMQPGAQPPDFGAQADAQINAEKVRKAQLDNAWASHSRLPLKQKMATPFQQYFMAGQGQQQVQAPAGNPMPQAPAGAGDITHVIRDDNGRIIGIK